jgi:alkanesulfonate monooxygenase SsuD/methylene tetrahydromethanopterin reductase-like flavin-dependent oxidoreductase (luciferase family)
MIDGAASIRVGVGRTDDQSSARDSLVVYPKEVYMFFGVSLPPFGDYSDSGTLADLAREAEAAGWDGFFVWDHMIFDPSWFPIGDPWVGLAAAAMQTSTIRLGTMVTPLPRRRPWKLARETVALDRLSGGRFILGVGIGDPAQFEYGFFGEETSAKARAGKLDEGLEILARAWSGELFTFEGEHYQLQEMRFRPTPVQTPRIPIWVAGVWPNKPPMRRAARWDGALPISNTPITADTWREIKAYVERHRTADTPFDLVHGGPTWGTNSQEAIDLVAPYAEAGVTWWLEDISPWRFGWKWEDPSWSPDAERMMRERILQGPPQL